METQIALVKQEQKPFVSATSERILEISGVKVMLDKDVAEALGSDTRHLNENAARSPKWDYLRQKGIENDYRFQITEGDMAQLRSQFATSNDFTKLPWVYTRKGCAYFGTSMNSPEACAQAVNLVEVFDKVMEARKLSPAEALQEMTRQMVEQERRFRSIEHSVADLKAHATTVNTEYYSIAGFASLRGLNLNVHQCKGLGKKAVAVSEATGYNVGEAYSEIFGKVNTYHVNVLNEVFITEKLLKQLRQ